MTTSLIIPFASDDDRRNAIFDWVEQRWADTFPDFEICIGHDDPKDFNRSKARNAAFNASTGETIVISDADTACPVQNVLGALNAVERENAPWVIAHDRYYSLTDAYTDWLLTQAPGMIFTPPFPSNWTMHQKSTAGVLVMKREAFEKAGGYNEAFDGWGWEDSAFAEVMNRSAGQAVRVFGPMLHLEHPRGLDFQQPHIAHNQALYEKTVRGE